MGREQPTFVVMGYPTVSVIYPFVRCCCLLLLLPPPPPPAADTLLPPPPLLLLLLLGRALSVGKMGFVMMGLVLGANH